MLIEPESASLPKQQILQAAQQTLQQLDCEEAVSRQQDTADRKTSTLLVKLCAVVLLCLGLVALGFALVQHHSSTASTQTHDTQ
jgi:hypothetical protein